jgi:anti-anti-sigma factor
VRQRLNIRPLSADNSAVTQQIHFDRGTLTLSGEITIYHAKALTDQLNASVRRKRAMRRVDLSQVTELDTAGVQILLALREWARGHQRELTFNDPSAAVQEVLQLLRIDLVSAANS